MKKILFLKKDFSYRIDSFKEETNYIKFALRCINNEYISKISYIKINMKYILIFYKLL